MKSTVFKEGDIVLVKRIKTSKVQNNLLGPYKIIAIRESTAILQKVGKTKEIIKAPVDQIIPYNNGVEIDVLNINVFSCADPRHHYQDPKCATQDILKKVCREIVTLPPLLQNHTMPAPLHLAKLLELLDNGVLETEMLKEIAKNSEKLSINKEYLFCIRKLICIQVDLVSDLTDTEG
ncbi:unnamed protein product [Auanema sp. JU1783]|nr:unnamed protein product [Auanema sp. JU1783]